MRAIIAARYGGPETMQRQDVTTPTIGDDEVLVAVRAISLQALDWHRLRADPAIVRLGEGLFRPKRTIRGVDIAGAVEAVGVSVDELRPGDEVFGWRDHGGGLAGVSLGDERTALRRHVRSPRPPPWPGRLGPCWYVATEPGGYGRRAGRPRQSCCWSAGAVGWGHRGMDQRGDWWMDANKRWHRGTPPTGWWQGEDRLWRPPVVQQAGLDPSEEPSKVRGHPTGRVDSPLHTTERAWTRWALYVIVALALLAAVAAVLASTVAGTS